MASSECFSTVRAFDTSEFRTSLSQSMSSIYDPKGSNQQSMHLQISGPIAIVGMACRFPGGVTSPEDLWTMLVEEKSGYTDIPSSRFSLDGWYHPDRQRRGTFVSRGGFFLDEPLHEFDHSFFNISPAEAAHLDPAQKKLLEVVYECLESSGTKREDVAGTETGVFVGNFNLDQLLVQSREIEYVDHYSATGSAGTTMSNRIHYAFDLKGPSFTVDTACSSSIYAVHLACNSIAMGDCKAAIVASANMIQMPDTQLSFSKLGVLSPTSQCHTFDAKADGYARAEGVAALYLKPLAAAIDAGDTIRAVIRGTAINASAVLASMISRSLLTYSLRNGRSNGISYPSIEGQQAVICRAYERAGISAEDLGLTGYFEFHGTGTPVGDPVEAAAVASVFSEHKSEGNPLLIGSIKTNLGHSEPVSGLCGIIKTVLAIENGAIPPTLGYETPNPKIPFHEWKLKVVTSVTPWPVNLPIRRASVNSFGFGGANGHVILEHRDSADPQFYRPRIPPTLNSTHEEKNHQATEPNGYSDNDMNQPLRINIAVVSANDQNALSCMVDHVARVSSAAYDIQNIAYTLSRRSELPHRAYGILREGRKLDVSTGVIHGAIQRAQVPQISFMFTGQGAQWPGMGRGLLRFCTFKAAVQAMDTTLQRIELRPGWLIYDIFAGTEIVDINEPVFSQTLCTALQVGIVDLLKSWGIEPTSSIGHSSGEIAAAYTAGLVSYEVAIVTAYLRGYSVTNHCSTDGGMLAVGLDPESASRYIARIKLPRIAIAAMNSVDMVTLSGPKVELDLVQSLLDEDKVFNRALATGGRAYHSPQMNEAGESYERLMLKAYDSLEDRFCKPQGDIEWYSSVTGRRWNNNQGVDAEYWRRNLESPVLFHSALKDMAANKSLDHIIEIGPHSALRGTLLNLSKTNTSHINYLSSLKRNSNGVECLLGLAGEAFLIGAPVDISRVVLSASGGKPKILHGVLGYRWNHTNSFHRESRVSQETRERKFKRHDILGSRVPGHLTRDREMTWRNMLSTTAAPWIEDHKLGDHVIFPAAGYIAMAAEALQQAIAEEVDRTHVVVLQDVVIPTGLIVSAREDVEVLTSLRPLKISSRKNSDVWWEFEIVSVVKDTSRLHCRGRIRAGSPPDGPHTEQASMVDDKSGVQQVLEPIDTTEFYSKCSMKGLNYGPVFRRCSNIARRLGSFSTGDVSLESDSGLILGESEYLYHPATVDCCLQIALASTDFGEDGAFLPTAFEAVTLYPIQPMSITNTGRVTVSTECRGPGALISDIKLWGANGQLLLHMAEAKLKLSDIGSQPDEGSEEKTRSPYFKYEWKPDFDYLDAAGYGTPTPAKEIEKTLEEFHRIVVLYLLEFSGNHPELLADNFEAGNQDLVAYVQWINEVIKNAKSGKIPGGLRLYSLSPQERREEIESLREKLLRVHPEMRLPHQLYDSLPEIIRNERTGISVGVQNDSLTDFYGSTVVLKGCSEKLAFVVDLLAHKNPNMKILEVGAGTGMATRIVLRQIGDEFPRYDEYVFTDIGSSFLGGAADEFGRYPGTSFRVLDIGKDPVSQGFTVKYDMVIASQVLHATENLPKTLINVRKLLKPGGRLVMVESTRDVMITQFSVGTFTGYSRKNAAGNLVGPFRSVNEWTEALRQSGFSSLNCVLYDYEPPFDVCNVLVTRAEAKQRIYEKGPNGHHSSANLVHVVHDGISSSFRQKIEHQGNIRGLELEFSTLRDLSRSRAATTSGDDQSAQAARYIILVDLNRPAFIDLDARELSEIQHIMRSAISVVWAGPSISRNPAASMAGGLLRTMKTESPYLRSVILHCDTFSAGSSDVEFLFDREGDLQRKPNTCEQEYHQLAGTWNIGRFTPVKGLNSNFLKDRGKALEARQAKLANCGPLQANLHSGGQPGNLVFLDDPSFTSPLMSNEVEIKVMAVGVNMDFAALSGHYDSNWYGSEVVGIVTKVGSRTESLAVGKTVITLAPTRFGTFVRVMESLCQIIERKHSFADLATVPLSYCTAIHALNDIARLEHGESILIQTATGGFGLAAIAIAKMAGAEIYATASTERKADYLFEKCGIPKNRIFSSRSLTAYEPMMDATHGRGFDVVCNTSSGDYFHEVSWKVVAEFGRLVDLKKVDADDAGRLDMSMFRKDTSFFAVDLKYIWHKRPHVIENLLSRVVSLYHEGSIQPINPMTEFPINDLDGAMNSFRRFDHIGKFVVTYNDETSVKHISEPRKTQFNPEAVYVIAGGLGGIGLALAKTMIQRGARHLMLISRRGLSNDDEPERRKQYDELIRLGGNVTVFKGDITRKQDVEAAFKSCSRAIRGIISGAMVLRNSPFSKMTHSEYAEAVRPKVHGTINLHEVSVETKIPLDYFVLLSSIVSIVAPATQSNYCMGTAFQNAFAQYRRSLGLPATSIALPMVSDTGFVERNKAAEASLMRNGFYRTSAREMLQLVYNSESLMPAQSPSAWLPAAIYLGLEPERLNGVADAFESTAMHADPQLSVVVLAMKQAREGRSHDRSDHAARRGVSSVMADDPIERFLEAICGRLSQLLWTEKESIKPGSSLESLGLDSMVAAELRQWLFKVFSLRVLPMELMDRRMSVGSLAAMSKNSLAQRAGTPN